VSQEAFFKIRLLNKESIKWLYTQKVKLQLHNTKTNEKYVEKKLENLPTF